MSLSYTPMTIQGISFICRNVLHKKLKNPSFITGDHVSVELARLYYSTQHIRQCYLFTTPINVRRWRCVVIAALEQQSLAELN